MIFLELKVVMFMKTNNQKRKVGYIIMKKKIIAIVCAVLMLVGSVGVAKAAGTCPPHYSSLQEVGSYYSSEVAHRYLYDIRYIDGEEVKIYKTCYEVYETIDYLFMCDKCGEETGGGCVEFLTWHTECGEETIRERDYF